MKQSGGWAHRAVAAAAVGFAVAAVAGPTVSVPSTPDVRGMVNVRGTQVAPLSNITVRFLHAKLAPVDIVAQATSNGSFVVRFEPLITGAYSVVVFDSSGQQIGAGSFGHYR